MTIGYYGLKPQKANKQSKNQFDMKYLKKLKNKKKEGKR